MEAHFNFLEEQFDNLVAEAMNEIALHHGTLPLTQDRVLPDPILHDHHDFIVSSIQRSQSLVGLAVFIRHMNLYTRNFVEHELIGLLIEKKCSSELNSKMANFAGNVERFCQKTTLTELISCQPELAFEKSIPPHFKDMVTELHIDPNDCTLSEIENFRRDTQAFLKTGLSGCALQMYTIKHDVNVRLQWIFPEEMMGKFFYADYQELLKFHPNVKIMEIDGKSSHSVSVLN